ncbi:MAG TPA: phosphodiester glycosidase family protein [Oscillatoriaceae cyanobacterium]
MKRAALSLSLTALLAAPALATPVSTASRVVGGVHVVVTRVDLQDPATLLTIGLAHDAPLANDAARSYGAESFSRMVARAHAAAVMNGTFFSKDAQERVMGNMVRAGRFVKYSRWENMGTTFGLSAGDTPEMTTARVDGRPNWEGQFFSLTCGPRLLRDGGIWLNPRLEGFTDPHVMGVARRSALGYTADGRTLLLASFRTPVSLAREAAVMRSLGAYQAMNLDGGSSEGLALGNRIAIAPGRALTNVIVVYDSRHPAPGWLKTDQLAFDGTRTPTGAYKVHVAKVPQLTQSHRIRFGGLAFHGLTSSPRVSLEGDELALSADNTGQLFAPWEDTPSTYTLSFEARPQSDSLSIYFDAVRTHAGLGGTSLEIRQADPAGIYLRQDGRALIGSHDLLVDRNWHHYELKVNADGVRVYMDHWPWPLLEADRRSFGDGIGLSGSGALRDFKLISG